MIITSAMQENIIQALGLDALSPDEQQAIFSKIGSSVVESALLQFLTAQGEWEQQSLESWVESHAMDGDILEQLITTYPAFGKILTEEILLIKENLEKNIS